MSNEELSGSATGGTRRPARRGVGGSPLGSTLSIVLAVVAVIAGFLILRNITDDSGGSSPSPDDAAADTSTTAGNTTTTEPAVTTTTLVTEGATVIVANASGVGGSAGRMTTALGAVGFTMGEPTNSTERIEDSLVYYEPSIAAAEAVANSVAIVMGGLDVATIPEPPPVEGGSIGDAGVLVLLGVNEADKTIAELSGATTETTTETTTATGTSPEPSGTTTTEATSGTTAATTTTTAATETTSGG